MPFDPNRKFVRVTALRPDGFVEFDFAVGEPDVFVEMLLPAAAFDQFCSDQCVAFLDPEAAVTVGDGFGWRLRNARRLGE